MFHVELAPLGGIFGPLKSDLGVFWPFRGTDFIMGKNKNANFSKSPHGPILKFCVVIREVILQKRAPILDPVNFFLVFSLISHFDTCYLAKFFLSGIRGDMVLLPKSCLLILQDNINVLPCTMKRTIKMLDGCCD